MKTQWAKFSPIAAVLLLSGCATMSGDECVTGDWYAIGFEDGSRGYTADRLGERRKACAKHGVTPDFRAYQDGREEGLAEFCQPTKGFNLGVNGGQYRGVCSAHNETRFLDAYNSGYQLYNLRANVSSVNHQIDARKREQVRIQDEMRHKEAALIDPDTTTEDRIMLLADLKDLSERSGQLETEIDGLIGDRAAFEQQLASYEAVLADSGY